MATIFPPYYGEFGWLVMNHLRHVHGHPSDVKIVCCEKGTELLYPSASQIVTFEHPVKDDVRCGDTVWGDTSIVDQHRARTIAEISTQFPSADIDELRYDCRWHMSDHVKFKPIAKKALPVVDVALGVRKRHFIPKCNFQHWAEVATALRKKGLTVGLCGAQESSADCEADAKSWHHPDGPTAGVVDLLTNCRLFVGTDSGLSHLAALMDIPQLVWYQPSQGSPDQTPVMERANKRYFRRLSSEVVEEPSAVINAVLRSIEDSVFDECYESIRELTLVSREKCQMLYRLSQYASVLDGDIAEVGVYRGGTSLLLRRANPAKTIHAFDTFDGIPNADPFHDRHRNGEFSNSGDEAVDRLIAAGINVHKGYFPQTAKEGASRRYCFVHFDADTYRSCRDFLEFFWPQMANGGVMVFDDWRWHNCPGVERAVLEHCDQYGCWPYHTAPNQVAITVCQAVD